MNMKFYTPREFYDCRDCGKDNSAAEKCKDCPRFEFLQNYDKERFFRESKRQKEYAKELEREKRAAYQEAFKAGKSARCP